MQKPTVEQAVSAITEAKCKKLESFSLYNITEELRSRIVKGEVEDKKVSHDYIRKIILDNKIIPNSYQKEYVKDDKGVKYIIYRPNNPTAVANTPLELLDI